MAASVVTVVTDFYYRFPSCPCRQFNSESLGTISALRTVSYPYFGYMVLLYLLDEG